MLYCENCRVKRKWTKSAAWPYAGLEGNSKCELCGETKECHDVPAVRNVRPEDKTVEQKTIEQALDIAFRDKAEGLVVTYLDGNFNQHMTDLLRQSFAKRNGEVDWYDTYHLRLKLQRDYRLVEEQKRDRRRHG